ncbi:MAG: hypothetical protein K6G89_07295 [Clostridia bacterium]|nr:hypothetical protein [Clostridia bacterium]
MNGSKRFIVRIALAAVAAVILAGISAFSGGSAAAEDAGSVVYPLWYEKYGARDEDTWKPGMSVQYQISTTVPIKSVTLNYFHSTSSETGPVGLEFTVRVYKWDTNILQSIGAEPILTQKCVSYEKKEADSDYAVTCDMSADPLPKGEYVFEFENNNSFSVLLSRLMPAPTGVRSYLAGRGWYGSFPGSIEFTEDAKFVFRSATLNYKLVYNEPPEEPVLTEDDPIVSLGVDSTKWGAVDGLGRTLPDNSETGDKKEKLVGIFYWTWHMGNRSKENPKNINNILEEYPEAVNDYYHQVWQTGGANFWNEPIYGYYIESDDYVLRKHAELLADAGIDFVLFDCTNGSMVWTEAYMNLLRVWSDARKDGVKTPKIAFMMQFDYSGNTRASLWDIYTNLYKKGFYKDLWFYLDGKPMVMAWETGLDTNVGDEAEIRSFFTYRHPIASYWAQDGTDDSWGWLSAYPQACYYNEDGTVEMTTVGIAQNANYETQSLSAMNSGKNMGRSYAAQPNYSYSYTYRGRRITVDSKIENSKFYGRNFQEQWDYAISKDPEIVFVTGWNEWIMGRYEEWCGVSNAFPDQCNDENSRDIEPSKGDLKDYYYYQLVANVRRFKGTSEQDYQPDPKTIDFSGEMSQWDDPSIVTYNHYANNTLPRNNIGFGELKYVSEGIRNDFVQTKVSYDKDNLWFYVKTASGITPFEAGNWMTLLIDSRAATAFSKDWEEFEYIIGREGTTADTMVLEKSTGGWNWESVGNVKYRVSGNEMVIEVPRKLLGGAGSSLDFGFKWCDNNLAEGDIMDLYTDGDAAPGGRFVFRFATKSAVKNGWVIPVIIVCCAVAAAAALAVVIVVFKKKKAEKPAENVKND